MCSFPEYRKIHKLRKNKYYREDYDTPSQAYDYDDDNSIDTDNQNVIPSFQHSPKSEIKALKKQVRLLRNEVNTLKKLSIINVFGSKANMKKFYNDMW